MKDMLPREMEIRDYLIGLIKETYKTYGFCSIETPCVEHIENLCSKQGGDNEKLIFKILKRGEKLKIDTAKEENDLVDGGLRYVEVVLNDNDRCAVVQQGLEHPQQHLHVQRVEADAGLIENEHRVGLGAADLAGQLEALGLAAGEKSCVDIRSFLSYRRKTC